jgi:serine/threonine protein kinase
LRAKRYELVQSTVHEGYIFTLSGIVTVGLDIALGMNYLHLCGWAHRDMNLGNFLVSEDWHIKVSDFGFGKFLGDIDSSLTADPGASAFRAPETTDSSYGLACDIWSFAVILSKLFLSDDVLIVSGDPDNASWIMNEEAQLLIEFMGRGNLRHFYQTREGF